MNKIMLIGNIGSDPELRHTAKGNPVCNFSLATNDHYSDQPQWHRIVVWGKPAEAVAKHMAKGKMVSIEGKVQYRKWQNREGQAQTTAEIHTTQVNFLSASNRNGSVEESNSENTPVVTPDLPPLSEEDCDVLF